MPSILLATALKLFSTPVLVDTYPHWQTAGVWLCSYAPSAHILYTCGIHQPCAGALWISHLPIDCFSTLKNTHTLHLCPTSISTLTRCCRGTIVLDFCPTHCVCFCGVFTAYACRKPFWDRQGLWCTVARFLLTLLPGGAPVLRRLHARRSCYLDSGHWHTRSAHWAGPGSTAILLHRLKGRATELQTPAHLIHSGS